MIGPVDGVVLRIRGDGFGTATLNVATGFTNTGTIESTSVGAYDAVLNVGSGTLTNAANGTITALPGRRRRATDQSQWWVAVDQ